jgi:phosphoglycolate phosphatase
LKFDIRSASFDLDGTLLDTVPDLAAAANGMLRELRFPERSIDELRTFVGGGIPRFVLWSLPTDRHDETLHAEAVEVFKRHYALSNGQYATLYPGVIEGLEGFRAQRIRMACVTNKAAAFSEPLLEMTGLAPYFEFTISGDSLPEKKPHPLPLLETCQRLGSIPSRHLHLGDSKHDAESAKAAGCISMTVPYGYNEGEDVRQMATDVIVPSVKAALDLVLM